MRKLTLQEFVSLDGLAAGPNDTVDFIPDSTAGDQSLGRQQMAFIDSIDTIALGSISLAQSLMSERLIDEYQLIICPIVLGSGKRLFRDADSFATKLLKTTSFDRGSVLLAYTAGNDRAARKR